MIKQYGRLLILGFIFVIMVCVNSCWYYSFKGTLPPHIKNICIPTFADETAEFNIQQVVTEQVRLGFINENILRLVDEDNANSSLYGTIKSVTDAPLTFEASDEGESVTEYRVTVRIEVEWYDNIEDKSLFKKNLSGFGEYDPTGATEATREDALQTAVDNLTEDIINAILAIW